MALDSMARFGVMLVCINRVNKSESQRLNGPSYLSYYLNSSRCDITFAKKINATIVTTEILEGGWIRSAKALQEGKLGN